MRKNYDYVLANPYEFPGFYMRFSDDIPNQKTFVPHMKSIKVLKEEKLPNGRVKQLIHQVNAVPVISDRDVVISAQTWSEPRDKGALWRSTSSGM